MKFHPVHIRTVCRYFAFLLLITVAIDHTLTAQTGEHTSLTGRVIDHETQSPIHNVNILIEGTQIGTSTDEEGNFTISNVPAGTQKLLFTHINYILYTYTHIFIPGISETLIIEMISRPILLDEVEVVDTLPRQYATGYHFDRKDIEDTAALTFGQLIQRLVPRARITESRGNLYIQLQLRQTIYQRHERMRDPYPLIIINGLKLGTSPIGLAGVAPASQIENVTIIRPPESQSIYGPEGAHGAIIIETRYRSDEDSLFTSRQLNMIVGGIVAFMLAMILIF